MIKRKNLKDTLLIFLLGQSVLENNIIEKNRRGFTLRVKGSRKIKNVIFLMAVPSRPYESRQKNPSPPPSSLMAVGTFLN